MNKSSLRQSRFVSIMLTAVNELIEATTDVQKQDIRSRLLDFTKSQAEIAAELIQIKPYNEHSLSIIQSFVAQMLKICLTKDEQYDRYIKMQQRVSAASLHADYNRSACGKISGDANAAKWRKAGVNNMGLPLWTDAERAQIFELLVDQTFVRTSGKYAGQINRSAVANAYIESNPETERTLHALRKQIRLQIKELPFLASKQYDTQGVA